MVSGVCVGSGFGSGVFLLLYLHLFVPFSASEKGFRRSVPPFSVASHSPGPNPAANKKAGLIPGPRPAGWGRSSFSIVNCNLF